MTVPKEKLEFHCGNVNQIVHDGINCQARRRMNLKLSGDVSAMGNHRVDGDIKVIGNLLVGHSLNQSHYHIFSLSLNCSSLIGVWLIMFEIFALTSFCFNLSSAFLTAGIKISSSTSE